MSARSAILLLLSGLYFWLCDYIYTCRIKQICYGCQTPQIVSKPEAPASVATLSDQNTEPVRFRWSDPNPVLSGKFEHFRASIAGRMKDSHVLEITGLYFGQEENNSTYANLGLARAHQLKILFQQLIPEDRIIIQGKLISEEPGAQPPLFESADFYWIPEKEASK